MIIGTLDEKKSLSPKTQKSKKTTTTTKHLYTIKPPAFQDKNLKEV
tara:strand:+ start:17002 stop:17139 length:138 start_codon:yes stop_codon:yes gene_type:complete